MPLTAPLKRAHERLRTHLVTLESALSMGAEARFVLRNTAFSLAKQLQEHLRLEERVVTAYSRILVRCDEEMLARLALDHREERQHLRQLQRIFEGDLSRCWDDVLSTVKAFAEALRHTMDLQETQLFPLLELTDVRPEAPNRLERVEPNPPLTETMTLAEVLRRYPNTRRLLERYGIRLSFEQYDALDEVAWHHGMSSQELLNGLEDAIASPYNILMKRRRVLPLRRLE